MSISLDQTFLFPDIVFVRQLQGIKARIQHGALQDLLPNNKQILTTPVQKPCKTFYYLYVSFALVNKYMRVLHIKSIYE